MTAPVCRSLSGTTISLFGSGLSNSLTLKGSRTIKGGETYIAGNGDQAGSLTLGGSTYEFSNTIGSVTDQVKITGSLVVQALGNDAIVSLTSQKGSTQTLSGLANGGAGDTLTYRNKNLVNLELFGTSAQANLNATAAAAGEHFFVVDLFGDFEGMQINATPRTVDTSVVAGGQANVVVVAANAGRVFINGVSSTVVDLGSILSLAEVTSGIKQDVFVENVGTLAVADAGNTTTQEHVTATESTISGSGLFGNDAVVVHYSLVGNLNIETGQLAETYAIVGSQADTAFTSQINILDNSTVLLNVAVTLDAGSGLNLDLHNSTNDPAELFISAVGGTISPDIPVLPTGVEVVTFAGGLTSQVSYSGFNAVTLAT